MPPHTIQITQPKKKTCRHMFQNTEVWVGRRLLPSLSAKVSLSLWEGFFSLLFALQDYRYARNFGVILAWLSPSLLKNATKHSVTWHDANRCNMDFKKIRKGHRRGESHKKQGKMGKKGTIWANCSLLVPRETKTASANAILDGSVLFSLTSILWNDSGRVLLVRLSIYTMLIQ